MFHLLKLVLRAQEQMQRLVFPGNKPAQAQGHMLEKQGQAHLPLEPELNLGSELEMVFLKLT